MSQDNQNKEKLIRAYNTMMQRAKEILEKAEKAAEPRLKNAIEVAEEKAVELGELTREEAVKVGNYLRRDLQDAGEYLAGPEGQELKNWLRFDIQLIEREMLDLFLRVADKAKLDMMNFEEQLFESTEYHTGEITGPGTLECEQCGEVLHFHDTGHIPPCPKCHGTIYTRGNQ